MRGRPLSGRPLSGRPLSGRPLSGRGYSQYVPSGGGGATFSPFSVTLFDAMEEQPDAARKVVIDTFIKALVKAGVWDKLDVLYVFAAHTEQAALLNWVNPGTFDATAINSPTFTTDEGFTGDGSTSYIDTNYNASTQGTNYTLDDASMWTWILTNLEEQKHDIGATSGASDRAVIGVYRNASGSSELAINDQTQTNRSLGADSRGFWGLSRINSSTSRVWKNGVQQGVDISVTSANIPNAKMRVLSGFSGFRSARQCALAAFGANLDGKEAAFYSAALAYMQAVGAVE